MIIVDDAGLYSSLCYFHSLSPSLSPSLPLPFSLLTVWLRCGSMVQFECSLIMLPLFPLFFLSPSFFKVLTNGTLVISNLRASDQQQYMCEASSSIGRSTSTVSLLVTGKA